MATIYGRRSRSVHAMARTAGRGVMLFFSFSVFCLAAIVILAADQQLAAPVSEEAARG